MATLLSFFISSTIYFLISSSSPSFFLPISISPSPPFFSPSTRILLSKPITLNDISSANSTTRPMHKNYNKDQATTTTKTLFKQHSKRSFPSNNDIIKSCEKLRYDVASRAVISPIIFEGTAEHMENVASFHHDNIHNYESYRNYDNGYRSDGYLGDDDVIPDVNKVFNVSFRVRLHLKGVLRQPLEVMMMMMMMRVMMRMMVMMRVMIRMMVVFKLMI